MALLMATSIVSILATVTLPEIGCTPLASEKPNVKFDNFVEKEFDCYAKRQLIKPTI